MAEAEEVLLKLLLGLHPCDVPGAESAGSTPWISLTGEGSGKCEPSVVMG